MDEVECASDYCLYREDPEARKFYKRENTFEFVYNVTTRREDWAFSYPTSNTHSEDSAHIIQVCDDCVRRITVSICGLCNAHMMDTWITKEHIATVYSRWGVDEVEPPSHVCRQCMPDIALYGIFELYIPSHVIPGDYDAGIAHVEVESTGGEFIEFTDDPDTDGARFMLVDGEWPSEFTHKYGHFSEDPCTRTPKEQLAVAKVFHDALRTAMDAANR